MNLAESLSGLRSECSRCGEWELFTGRIVEKEGRLHAVLRCPVCGGDTTVWRPDFEPTLEAYRAARRSLTDPGAYDAAWERLQARDRADVAAFVVDLQEGSAPPEAPFFRIESLRLPRNPDVAQAWAELALEHPGFVPAPTLGQRVEEALATAVHFDCPPCAEVAAQHLGALDAEALASVLDRLPVRLGGARAGPALVPFLRAVRAAGGAHAQALKKARLRWSAPELREAARRASEG